VLVHAAPPIQVSRGNHTVKRIDGGRNWGQKGGMKEALKQLRLGDHAVLFYRNRAEQFATAIPFIQIGLERNERCLYIAGDNSPAVVISAMEKAGIDVTAAQRTGCLTVAAPEQTYLKHGIFEPSRMLEGLNEEIQQSLKNGFSGFRATGELGWAAALPSALIRLYEYECRVETELASSFTVLCQYNETLFPARTIGQMVRIHRKIIARGTIRENPHYIGPTKSLEEYPLLCVDEVIGASQTCPA
jgi:hypothetical protein